MVPRTAYEAAWTCFRLVESGLVGAAFLELGRANEAECGVAPAGIIEAIDVTDRSLGRFSPRLQDSAPSPLALQRLEERLDLAHEPLGGLSNVGCRAHAVGLPSLHGLSRADALACPGQTSSRIISETTGSQQAVQQNVHFCFRVSCIAQP